MKKLICILMLIAELWSAIAGLDFTKPLYTDTLKRREKEEIWRVWCKQFNRIEDMSLISDEQGKLTQGIEYYGTYNGYPVLHCEGQLCMVTKLYIADELFLDSNAANLWAYDGDQLIELKIAYESGLVSAEDVAKIAKAHFDAEAAVYGYEAVKERYANYGYGKYADD